LLGADDLGAKTALEIADVADLDIDLVKTRGHLLRSNIGQGGGESRTAKNPVFASTCLLMHFSSGFPIPDPATLEESRSETDFGKDEVKRCGKMDFSLESV
jgi:hypothetical protein